MGKIRSVNVGDVTTLLVRGAHVASGIDKRPVAGPRPIGPDGLTGDVLVEPRKAGRTHHAVYVFAQEHVDFWQHSLGRPEPFAPGHFGENLTTESLLETEVRIGDIVRAGTAVLQVTQPRIPCRKLNARMGFSFARRFLESRRTGFYLRVLESGVVQADDAIDVIDSDGSSPTVDDFTRIAERDYWNGAALRGLLAARDLIPFWREILEGRLARAEAADGWFGFRPVRVVDVKHISADVVVLGLSGGAVPLPSFVAGQHITIGLRVSDDAELLRRPYALSGDPADHERYEITVERRGTDARDVGVVSDFLCRKVRVGDELRIAAPRGSFTLAEAGAARDLVFIVGGIGLAQVTSMLDAFCKAPEGRRATVLLDDAATQIPLWQPYTHSDAVTISPWSAERVARLALRPGGVAVFLAGPGSFTTARRQEILDLGIPERALHEERVSPLGRVGASLQR